MKFALAVLFAIGAAAIAGDVSPRVRRIEKPGLGNFHRVTPNLYRGAQPTAEGLRSAEALGVKTVIDLRAFHTDRDEAKGTKLKLEHIPFNTWHAEDSDVIRFLKVVTARKSQPVFVHCLHGSDRTGTMIAVYRIAVQGWTKQDAIHEMTKGDYGFHPVWKNLIRYIEKLDVVAVKKRAGLVK